MSVGYTIIEKAVRQHLADHLGLSLGLCQVGDMDAMFNEVFTLDAPVCAILEYGGGSKMLRTPFKEPVWVWTIGGALFIRYVEDTIEALLRQKVDLLRTTFDEAPRLGVASLLSLNEIGIAEPIPINETPFYWLPFTIEAIDK